MYTAEGTFPQTRQLNQKVLSQKHCSSKIDLSPLLDNVQILMKSTLQNAFCYIVHVVKSLL